MQYILILYAYASNAILVEPIKSRIDTDILLEYDTLYDTLETAEHAPKLNIMYNLASTALNILLQKRKTVLQLAPPHINIRNASEHAIRTFKNSLVDGLALVEKKI